MIAFNCPSCGKAYLTPDRDAGTQMPCRGCGIGLAVPAPRQRSARPRRLGLLVLVLGLMAAAVLLTLRASRPSRSEILRDRLAAELNSRSARWQGIAWDTCDPENGQYRLTVYYAADRETYALSASCFQETGASTIQVNPTSTGRLARAFFQWRELRSFEYHGHDADEQKQLKLLVQDLEAVLAHVLGTTSHP